MPDEIRVNRQPQKQQPDMKQDMPMSEQMDSVQSNSKAPWIILAVVVVVIVILGFLFRDKLMGGNKMSAVAGQASGYQAVFLTNGQVYFGKIANVDGDYVDLSDIFYLQVGPQQGSGTAAPANQAQAQQQISLVKLGNELHGPVDEMHISRAQILFYEDLKSDGQVVTAIERYKANPSGGAQPTGQQAPAVQQPAPTK